MLTQAAHNWGFSPCSNYPLTPLCPVSVSPCGEEFPFLKQTFGISGAFVKSILLRLTGGSPVLLLSEAALRVKGEGPEGGPRSRGPEGGPRIRGQEGGP